MNSILDDDKFHQLDSDKIIAELTSAIDALNIISSKARLRSNQFIHQKQDSKLNSDKNELNVKEIDFVNQIPEYEVFETYFEDDEIIEKYVEKFDDFSYTNPKLPDTLYGELKSILDEKAKDHRIREAKALGVNEKDLVLPLTTIDKR